MAENIESLILLLRFAVSYFLLFYFFPALVIDPGKEHNGILEKWVICLIHSHFFIIAAVHLLALSKLYETFSLYGVVLIAFVYLFRRRIQTGSVSLGTKQIMAVLDLTDNRSKLIQSLRGKALEMKGRALEALRRGRQEFIRTPVGWVGILASLAVVAVTRFSHSVTHGYFGSSDPYVHLKWAKSMSSNVLYVDGVYPYGFEAVIAAMNKFFMMDPYYIVRFIGPFGGVLLMGTILFALRRNYPRDVLMIFAVFAIIAASSWMYGGYVWRQMSALSMEYGILFFFPGIHYLAHYFRSGKPMSMFLAAECLILTLFIHPYVAVCAGVAYIIVFLLHADRVLRSGKNLLRLAVIFLSAGAIGVMPLALGVVSGLQFHETSVDFIQDSVVLGAESARSWSKLWSSYEDQPFFVALLAGLGLLGILTLVAAVAGPKLRRQESDWRMNLVFLLLGVFFFGMYQAGALGLPVFIPEYRLEIFFVIGAAMVMALAIKQAVFFIRNTFLSGSAKLVCAILLLTFFFSRPGHAIPPGDRFQYDEAVDAYMEIRGKFPHQEWTIISTIEEYSMVLGYGWHYNLWEFSKMIRERSEKEFRIPTNYVFLFVEKVPLGMNRTVTKEDAEQPFPSISGSRLDDYYRVLEKRLVIEAVAYEWAEQYRKTHDQMKIFMDTPSMRIYLLEQDGNHPVNLLE